MIESEFKEKAVFRHFGAHRLLSALPLALLVACAPPADEAAVEQAEAETEMAVEAIMDTVSSAEARVYFITPANGDTVSSPVMVSFGIEGMAVVPAGQDTPQSGHHHLIIDAALPDMSLPVPKDANHVHFGDGSASTELTLEPGEHTLQLLFANFLHIPHDPAIKSAQITITVE